uniref:Uncharacterized protein n=1 Tax=Porphyridium purpureum TaxID=35688 RepID=W0S217_PORPP|nr:hypothetical protein Y721_p050 [Porphyridium purpureum]BAO23758.1 hypothetical protein [Porphyridium purpureum]
MEAILEKIFASPNEIYKAQQIGNYKLVRKLQRLLIQLSSC